MVGTPVELEQLPSEKPPAVRSEEVVRDIGAVVSAIREDHDRRRVALIGWATGGHWSGMDAMREPDAVSHLAMLNSLYLYFREAGGLSFEPPDGSMSSGCHPPVGGGHGLLR